MYFDQNNKFNCTLSSIWYLLNVQHFLAMSFWFIDFISFFRYAATAVLIFVFYRKSILQLIFHSIDFFNTFVTQWIFKTNWIVNFHSFDLIWFYWRFCLFLLITDSKHVICISVNFGQCLFHWILSNPCFVFVFFNTSILHTRYIGYARSSMPPALLYIMCLVTTATSIQLNWSWNCAIHYGTTVYLTGVYLRLEWQTHYTTKPIHTNANIITTTITANNNNYKK